MGNTIVLSSYDPRRDQTSTAVDPHALTWEQRGLKRPGLESTYVLPVGWLALFGPDSIVEGPEDDLRLLTTAERARERLAARIAALRTIAGIYLRYVVDAFETKLVPSLKPSIALRLHQLVIMSSPGRFAAELRVALDAIEDPARLHEMEPAIRGMTSLTEDWRKRPNVAELLFGSGKAWPPRETQADKDRAYYFARHALGHAEGAVPYDPASFHTTGSALVHPTFGVGFVTRELEGGKIDVHFQTGHKALVHRRTRS